MFDRYLAANLVLWLLTYLLTTIRSLDMGLTMKPGDFADMAGRRALMCLLSIGVCMGIQRILLAGRGQALKTRLPLAATLAVAGGVFYTLVNEVVFTIGRPTWSDGSLGEYVLGMAVNFSALVWSFVAWCAIVLALSYDEDARWQNLRLVEAQALAAESQNQMLRYQINPHFLFNTLNALSSLILEKDFTRAERMVLSLSTFLRASLEAAPDARITLAREIEAQRQYLAIEQERFGDRLILREAIPAELSDVLVPSLILQPLVENAVKYGVARTSRPVLLEIVAEQDGARLRVTVRDDAVSDAAPTPQTLGVGLENVRRRLAVFHGAEGVLTAGPRPGGGFSAAILLPLERG